MSEIEYEYRCEEIGKSIYANAKSEYRTASWAPDKKFMFVGIAKQKEPASSLNPPREFKLSVEFQPVGINGTDKNIYCWGLDDNIEPDVKDGEEIHVIEYSAYEGLRLMFNANLKEKYKLIEKHNKESRALQIKVTELEEVVSQKNSCLQLEDDQQLMLRGRITELEKAIRDNYENHPLKAAWEKSESKVAELEKQSANDKEHIDNLKREFGRKCSENALLTRKLEKAVSQRNELWMSEHSDPIDCDAIKKMDIELELIK